MSYLIPAGNAVDFSWVGALSYTAPPGSAIVFEFSQPFNTSGFSSTAFGSPAASYNQLGSATAIAPIESFGPPVADFTTRYIASGATPSAAFGAPSSIYPQTGATVGFRRWTFGTPTRRVSNYAPTIAVSTKFGTPKCNARLVGQVISCPVSTHFGTLVCRTGTMGVPLSIHSIVFGVPVVRYTQTGAATGFSSTQFGTPRKPLDESLDTMCVVQKTNRVDVWSDA